MVLPRLAIEAQRVGELDRARALCTESLEIHRRLGFRKAEARVLLTLAYIDGQLGRWEEALALADDSERLAAEVGSRWWQVASLEAGAEYALRLGRTEDAGTRAAADISLARAIGDRRATVYGLATLAWIAVEGGSARRAGTLWGAIEAEAARGPIGQWEEDGRGEFEPRVLAAAGPRFEEGLADGRTLTLDEAVEYAVSDID
jgi:hypothetical protein